MSCHRRLVVQTLPKYPGAVPPRGVTGVVEIVINEGGAVESAAMVVPVTSPPTTRW